MQIPPIPPVEHLPGEIVLLRLVDQLAPVMVFFIITVGLLIAYLIRSKNRRLPTPLEPLALRPLEERLGRIEQAVEAIGLEVERIAEGQRFVTKALGEAPRNPAQIRAGQ